jgi:hypothetical protein
MQARILRLVEDRAAEGDLRLLPPDTCICSKCAIQVSARGMHHKCAAGFFAVPIRLQSRDLLAAFRAQATTAVRHAESGSDAQRSLISHSSP